MKLVSPVFSTTVALPQTITIPAFISKEASIPRRLIIRHGDKMPDVLIEWMLSDPRYGGWLAEDQPWMEEEAEAEEVIKAEVPDGLTEAEEKLVAEAFADDSPPPEAEFDFTIMPGVGPKKAEKFKEAGIFTLSDFHSRPVIELTEALEVSEETVLKWLDYEA